MCGGGLEDKTACCVCVGSMLVLSVSGSGAYLWIRGTCKETIQGDNEGRKVEETQAIMGCDVHCSMGHKPIWRPYTQKHTCNVV